MAMPACRAGRGRPQLEADQEDRSQDEGRVAKLCPVGVSRRTSAGLSEATAVAEAASLGPSYGLSALLCSSWKLPHSYLSP